MKYKNKIFIYLVISATLFIAGYFLSEPTRWGICGYWNVKCGNIISEMIGAPVLLFSFSVFIISLILLFVREQVFGAWTKFAKIYIPISILLIAITPDSGGDMLDLDKELATWFLAGIFLISSIGIIIFKSFKKQ